MQKYFNPRPPWGGRRGLFLLSFEFYVISIHALRGEGDAFFKVYAKAAHDFNPRPPWGGRPSTHSPLSVRLPHFNPRPPWGGRRRNTSPPHTRNYFNPRPPWGGRHGLASFIGQAGIFQSTPSVGRATCSAVPCKLYQLAFQSTPSVGRATKRCCRYSEKSTNFNPRPPWGGRRRSAQVGRRCSHFNPRPPWGGRLE